MATEKKLTDQHSAWIASDLSANQAKMMAVIYMKMSQSDLDNFTSVANGDQEEIIRLLFRKWRNITNATLQVTQHLCMLENKRKSHAHRNLPCADEVKPTDRQTDRQTQK